MTMGVCPEGSGSWEVARSTATARLIFVSIKPQFFVSIIKSCFLCICIWSDPNLSWILPQGKLILNEALFNYATLIAHEDNKAILCKHGFFSFLPLGNKRKFSVSHAMQRSFVRKMHQSHQVSRIFIFYFLKLPYVDNSF